MSLFFNAGQKRDFTRLTNPLAAGFGDTSMYRG